MRSVMTSGASSSRASCPSADGRNRSVPAARRAARGERPPRAPSAADLGERHHWPGARDRGSPDGPVGELLEIVVPHVSECLHHGCPRAAAPARTRSWRHRGERTARAPRRSPTSSSSHRYSRTRALQWGRHDTRPLPPRRPFPPHGGAAPCLVRPAQAAADPPRRVRRIRGADLGGDRKSVV